MPGRILIADPVAPNRIMLRVTLKDAFYDVAMATSGQEALAHAAAHPLDLIIAADDLADMTGAEFCEVLRARRGTAGVPAILLGSELDPQACCRALQAGADDYLPRHMDDMVLLARMRSLVRARDAESELRLREDTQRALGLAEAPGDFVAPPQVVFISSSPDAAIKGHLSALEDRLPGRFALLTPADAMRQMDQRTDVAVILETDMDGGEALSLLSELRANRDTRHVAILFVACSLRHLVAATALDLGANELMSGAFDIEELALRLQRQITRKRTTDRLRDNMQLGIRAALTDPLTGLYNRRYALPHLDRLTQSAQTRACPLAIAVLDLDHFKRLNDRHGHDAGDRVLRRVAEHLTDHLRAADLVARIGGEEFLVVMPDTPPRKAERVAQRITTSLAALSIPLEPSGTDIAVTASTGLAITSPGVPESAHDLLQRADRAMYAAKRAGRNQVYLSDEAPGFDMRSAYAGALQRKAGTG